MSEHKASTHWKRETEDFNIKTFKRDHEIRFPNGVTIQSSSAPDFTGNPDFNNPEDLFVASISSCHMLTFLAVSAIKNYTVDSYTDHAVGILEKNNSGKTTMNRIILKPEIVFGGQNQPSQSEIDKLHEKAHKGCFIANSITSNVEIKTP